jgi:4-hydroxy-tetrahydrodipicolinate reductase
MNILLLGYGKMGKTIEKTALSRHHHISFIIDKDNQEEKEKVSPDNTQVAIEFSQPEAAYDNLRFCIDRQIPVVCGTTGWLEHKPALEAYCLQQKGAFLYASNFSVGVNLFFELNKWLARLMAAHPQYGVSLTEVHHIHKKDAPSGTAITLAESILNAYPQLSHWVSSVPQQDQLSIQSLREGDVPGTHTVHYHSETDSIEITHTAHNREGFALGAVLSAEWLAGRQGIFSMADVLGF